MEAAGLPAGVVGARAAATSGSRARLDQRVVAGCQRANGPRDLGQRLAMDGRRLSSTARTARSSCLCCSANRLSVVSRTVKPSVQASASSSASPPNERHRWYTALRNVFAMPDEATGTGVGVNWGARIIAHGAFPFRGGGNRREEEGSSWSRATSNDFLGAHRNRASIRWCSRKTRPVETAGARRVPEHQVPRPRTSPDYRPMPPTRIGRSSSDVPGCRRATRYATQ